MYDTLKALRRRLLLKYDLVYFFFDSFSKFQNGNIAFVQIVANDGLRNDPIREFIISDR